MKKIFCVSAVNLVNGGTLTILQNCLESLYKYALYNDIEIYAIVHKKELCFYPGIRYIEIPWAKKNWINRVYCEYFYLKKISQSINPDVWLSLHDITPNVTAKIQAVYCHNPMPFHSSKFSDLKYNYKEFLFSKFYKYLYRINIKKNSYVIVQQDWLRTEFCNLFHLDKNRVIVAKPYYEFMTALQNNILKTESGTVTFFYPSFPRTFKNFEVICEASTILNSLGINNFKVILTINGSENKYSTYIYRKYSKLKNIDFCGLLPMNKVHEMYCLADCLLFPSKLETWGLPISEFSQYKKPMIISDLQYAHETAAGISNIAFFDPTDSYELAQRMKEVIDNSKSSFVCVPTLDIASPFTNSWEMLFDILLDM